LAQALRGFLDPAFLPSPLSPMPPQAKAQLPARFRNEKKRVAFVTRSFFRLVSDHLALPVE
jgi:hypothetical protein